MLNITVCPVCQSDSLETVLRVQKAPTSDGALVDAEVDTTLCLSCGFAFNASGARGDENAFYSDTYNLLADSDEAEFKYGDAGSLGINDEMAQFLVENCVQTPGASVLDVGCGKGLLLRAFGRRRSDLALNGVEPSRNARRFSERIMPQVAIHVGVLAESPCAQEQYDLVTSIGVVEHVPDPVAFLRELAARVAPGGHLFVSVPNVEDNPTDVVTYDHLSRFTPGTLRAALGRAGLIVEKLVSGGRVPMWAIARHAQADETPEIPVDDGLVARRAAQWFLDCMEQYGRMAEAVRGTERRVGVYGTGLALPAAVALGIVPQDRLVVFFDDNASMHGATRLGCPVRPLLEAPSLGVTDVTFSANPVYLNRMLSALNGLGGQWQVWPLPPFHGN